MFHDDIVISRFKAFQIGLSNPCLSSLVPWILIKTPWWARGWYLRAKKSWTGSTRQ